MYIIYIYIFIYSFIYFFIYISKVYRSMNIYNLELGVPGFDRERYTREMWRTTLTRDRSDAAKLLA